MNANCVNFPAQGSRPLPRKLAKPSEYGLALAASRLVNDWGTEGAINRLIEVAECIQAGGDPVAEVLRRRRVE